MGRASGQTNTDAFTKILGPRRGRSFVSVQNSIDAVAPNAQAEKEYAALHKLIATGQLQSVYERLLEHQEFLGFDTRPLLSKLKEELGTAAITQYRKSLNIEFEDQLDWMGIRPNYAQRIFCDPTGTLHICPGHLPESGEESLTACQLMTIPQEASRDNTLWSPARYGEWAAGAKKICETCEKSAASFPEAKALPHKPLLTAHQKREQQRLMLASWISQLGQHQPKILGVLTSNPTIERIGLTQLTLATARRYAPEGIDLLARVGGDTAVSKLLSTRKTSIKLDTQKYERFLQQLLLNSFHKSYSRQDFTKVLSEVIWIVRSSK